MPAQTTPHTQTQPNADPASSDVDGNRTPGDSAQEEDASLYANIDGAQTGDTRAFNANADDAGRLNTEPRSAALTGGIDTRTPESNQQGITNHSVSEENITQRKVVSERPDAQAGVDQTGHSIRSGS